MEKLSSQPASSNKVILTLVYLIFLLIPLLGFSQTKAESNVTTLEKVVENIKAKNESIKDAEHVNVMVNDLLIQDLKDFKIDPQNIAMVEVLVLNPKAGSNERIKSIIINTRN